MKRNIKGILISLFWILLWQIIALVVGSKLLLPSPIDTLNGLFTLALEASFYQDVLATVGRCIAAIILSLLAGLILSLLSYRFRMIRDVLSLPVAFFKAVPVMAIAIYFLLLLSSGEVPVLVCWLMCFPIVYTNLLTGLDSFDADILEMADLYEIKGKMRIKHILIPSLYPYFKSSMSIIAGMSWKAIVTAEVLSVPSFSLGYELMNAKYYLNTDLLFAYVLVIILISILFEKLINNMLRHMEPKAYIKSKVLKNQLVNTSKDKSYVAPKIIFKDVCKSFGEKKVLENFNMTLKSAKVTALIGSSGSGKTTIAKLLYGKENPDCGEIVFSEASKIAVLFQEDRLIPWLNVFDNLALVVDNENEIENYLKQVGLDKDQHKLPSELSGGMCRRLSIARALAYANKSRAGVVIADEPFRGLDETTKAKVIEDLWKPRTAGRTVMLITHIEDEVKALAQEIKEINSLV